MGKTMPSVTGTVPPPYTLTRRMTAAWLYPEVADAQSTLIALHIQARLNEQFEGRPADYRAIESANHVIGMILDGYPDRHFDYQAVQSAVRGMRLLCSHVRGNECVWHMKAPWWDDEKQAWAHLWTDTGDVAERVVYGRYGWQ